MTMRRISLLFMVLAGGLLLCSCNESRFRNAFLSNDTIRLQIGSTLQFEYDPLTCQAAYNSSKKQFRVQTDNTSDFYVLTLSDVPVSVGQNLSADLVWTTPTDILKRNNLSLEVIKIEGETVWLWSSSSRIGVSIMMLE